MSELQDLERQFLIERLKILKTNLGRLELMRAEYGINAPLSLLNEIDKQKNEIAEVEEQLRAQSAADLPSLETPHNLPHAVGGFVGRATEIDEALERIEGRWPVICFEGIGGIGKTSLAIEVSHRALERKYFDGVIWTSAKDRKPVLNDLLDIVARTLERENLTRLPKDEKLSAVHKLLRTRRYQVIVDNFETIEDERILQFVIDIQVARGRWDRGQSLAAQMAW